MAGQVEGSGSVQVVTTALGEGDVPLAPFSGSFRVKSGRKDDLFRLSRKGRPNIFPASGGDEGGWVFTEEVLQRVSWAKLFAPGLKNAREMPQN